MKRMMTWRWAPAALLLALAGTMGSAEEFAIQSFDGAGRMTFNEVSTAETYRVEWAPTPSGPWTNFTGAAGAALDEIVAKGSGIVTCSVPMCYRVVATVTNAPGQPPPVPQGMVKIPAGSNSGTVPDFGAYSLMVETFYMDLYEVTKARWDEVANWAAANGYDINDATAFGKAANHPAQEVTGYECVKWCNARSQKEGKTPCYTVGGNVYMTGDSEPDCDFAANGYRLPTNTEWEYAARGGQSGKQFPWCDSDDIQHSRANYYSLDFYSYDTSTTREFHPDYDDGGYPYTSPVGSFAANGYGLYDMAGNVWEWCWDASGSDWALRGGSWAEYADVARCGYLNWDYPYRSYNFYGFRAVCR
jgi:formylglycine-generating enzyme required for sulfatase activity